MGNTLGRMRRPQLLGVLVLCLLVLVGGTASTVVVPETRAAHQDVITATTLATAQLENLKALGAQRLRAMAPDPLHEAYTSMTDFPTFRRQTTLADNTPDIGMHTATVTVFWERDAHAVRLSLILAE